MISNPEILFCPLTPATIPSKPDLTSSTNVDGMLIYFKPEPCLGAIIQYLLMNFKFSEIKLTYMQCNKLQHCSCCVYYFWIKKNSYGKKCLSNFQKQFLVWLKCFFMSNQGMEGDEYYSGCIAIIRLSTFFITFNNKSSNK